MDALVQADTWIALLTLTALEIVLGVDNIIFLAIMASKLPREQQAAGRLWGLAGAMVTRILLLLSLTWLSRLTQPLITLYGTNFSGRDLILLGGGLFLIMKSTLEIHAHVEEDEPETRPRSTRRAAAGFVAVVVQIMLLDIVFSLDSVITAIGMTQLIGVMVAAIVLAIIIMMLFSGTISRFVDRHPTIKILALSFLILIGMALVGESLGAEVPKGYIYFAMAFSTVVEMINLQVRNRRSRRQTVETQ